MLLVVIIVTGEYLMNGSSPDNFGSSEIFGYVTFVACLGMIYLAFNEVARSDAVKSETIWQKTLLGVAISAVAGLIFGFYNVIYTSYINPAFLDDYYNYYISQLPVQSGPEYDAMVASLEAEKQMFMQPLTQFFVMATTVIAVGIPESVILAVIHKKLAKGQ